MVAGKAVTQARRLKEAKAGTYRGNMGRETKRVVEGRENVDVDG
jgi:hypothetical protein